MKKLLLSAGLLAMAAAFQPAAAADMAVKAPILKAPPVEVWSWTGFYIGGNAGYSWGQSDTVFSFFNNTTGVIIGNPLGASFDMNGWVAGGQIGYNWQSGAWVFGLEADIQATGQDGDAFFTCAPFALCNLTAVPNNGTNQTTALFSQKLDWFGTLRARLGYTVTPTMLLYVTGGLAYGQVSTDIVVNGFTGAPPAGAVTSISSFEQTKAGWTIGAGVEGRITGNWTAKLEYLYVDLGSFSGAAVTTALQTNGNPIRVNYSSDITDNIIRLGLNYKFGGPIVARY